LRIPACPCPGMASRTSTEMGARPEHRAGGAGARGLLGAEGLTPAGSHGILHDARPRVPGHAAVRQRHAPEAAAAILGQLAMCPLLL